MNKFDFNDKLFELSDKIYVAPMCPARDGFDYKICKRKWWCGYEAHYPGNPWFSKGEPRSSMTMCKSADDLVRAIRDENAHCVRDQYNIFVKEAGGEWKWVAYIKPEDIK